MSRNWINNWPEGSTPRSLPYREGFQLGYNKTPIRHNLYPPGTAEHDAFWAGHDAGKARLVYEKLFDAADHKDKKE